MAICRAVIEGPSRRRRRGSAPATRRPRRPRRHRRGATGRDGPAGRGPRRSPAPALAGRSVNGASDVDELVEVLDQVVDEPLRPSSASPGCPGRGATGRPPGRRRPAASRPSVAGAPPPEANTRSNCASSRRVARLKSSMTRTTPRRFTTSRMSSDAHASICSSASAFRRARYSSRVGRQPRRCHAASCSSVVGRVCQSGRPAQSPGAASGSRRPRQLGRERRLPRALGPVVEAVGQPAPDAAGRRRRGHRRAAPAAASGARVIARSRPGPADPRRRSAPRRGRGRGRRTAASSCR